MDKETAYDEMLEVIEKIARECCLDQMLGDRCLCGSCKAREVLAKIEL